MFRRQQITECVNQVCTERAQSLELRFDQEESLLVHGNHKPWFGWGSWGRNRVRDETGKDLSVIDGKWIGTIGVKGWFGFLSEFMFVVVPIWLAYKVGTKIKDIDKKQRVFLSAHALIVSIILLDQMPNASMNALYWLLVGSLLGRVYELQEKNLQRITNMQKTN